MGGFGVPELIILLIILAAVVFAVQVLVRRGKSQKQGILSSTSSNTRSQAHLPAPLDTSSVAPSNTLPVPANAASDILHPKPKSITSTSVDDVPVVEATNASMDDISFIGATNAEERSIVIGIEEVPLDNRFGSSVLTSEHEFTHRANRTINITRSNNLGISLQAKIWSVLETEARGNLARSIGIDLQDEEVRRITLRFEAAPGRLVLYRVVWKQTQRGGEVEMHVDGKLVKLPYTATYGLSHSVESVAQTA